MYMYLHSYAVTLHIMHTHQVLTIITDGISIIPWLHGRNMHMS